MYTVGFKFGFEGVSFYLKSLTLVIYHGYNFRIPELFDKIIGISTGELPLYVHILILLSIRILVGIVLRNLDIQSSKGEDLESKERSNTDLSDVKTYLPGNMIGDDWNKEYRITKKIQCIGLLRSTDPNTGKDSYHFLGNDFLANRRVSKDNPYASNAVQDNIDSRTQDISFKDDFSGLENYNTKSIHQINMRINSIISCGMRMLGINYTIRIEENAITVDSKFLKDITYIIREYYSNSFTLTFRELDPRTKVVALPSIDNGHHQILQLLFVFGGFVNDPKLGEMMGNLTERDRRDLFESILNLYITKYSYGLMITYYCREFIIEFFKRLNPRNDETTRRNIKEALVLKEKREREKSFIDWIKDLHRISKNTDLIRYLPESVRGKVGTEMLAYSVILEKLRVLPHTQYSSYKRNILNGILASFRIRTLILIDDRSIDGHEGFLCKNNDSMDLSNILKSTNTCLHHFVNNFAWNDKDIIKSRIDSNEPSKIYRTIDFMVKGIRFYDGMDKYRVRMMHLGILHETVSFWEFKVREYVEVEDVIYTCLLNGNINNIISYRIQENILRVRGIPRERDIKDKSKIRDYLNSLKELISIPANSGILFCFRHLSLRNCYKILDNTDPDTGTHILASMVFVRFFHVAREYRKEYSNDTSSDLLDDWIHHYLPRFRGHRSFMSHVLWIIDRKYDVKNIRLDPLKDLDRDASLTYEYSLYVRIYASLRLMRHLAQCALQMRIYSGMTWDEDKVNGIGSVSLVDAILNSTNYYDNVIRESRYLNMSDKFEKRINDCIENLLGKWKEIIRHHGPEVFTYSSFEMNCDNIPGDDVDYADDHDNEDYDLSKLRGYGDTDITNEIEVSFTLDPYG